MRKIAVAGGVIGLAVALGACASIPRSGPVGNKAVPSPTRNVDLSRYMGRWYEQYRYEASFQKDMDFVSADYSLNPDSTVKVMNRGRKPNGKWKQSTGKAKIVDPDTNAKLKVSFFGPFYGDYWVLDHGEAYDWSIVGEPSGRYLWILTRDKQPAAELLNALEAITKSLGYDWELIRRTQQ